jgi:hypothetical protein
LPSQTALATEQALAAARDSSSGSAACKACRASEPGPWDPVPAASLHLWTRTNFVVHAVARVQPLKCPCSALQVFCQRWLSIQESHSSGRSRPQLPRFVLLTFILLRPNQHQCSSSDSHHLKTGPDRELPCMQPPPPTTSTQCTLCPPTRQPDHTSVRASVSHATTLCYQGIPPFSARAFTRMPV